MRKRLPAEVLHAPKRDFPTPFSQWLRGELLPAAQSWLLDSPFLRQYFVPQHMERLLQLHRRGRAHFDEEIYGLACLAVWHDVFARPTINRIWLSASHDLQDRSRGYQQSQIRKQTHNSSD